MTVNTADAEVTLPQEQAFGFFPRYYITSFFLALFFFGALLVIWLPALYMFYVEGVFPPPVVRATFFLTFSFFALIFLGRLSEREMEKVRFVISAQGISRRYASKNQSIAWDDIVAIRCRSLPLLKSFIEVRSSATRLILPSTIKDFGRLAQALSEGLAASGRGDLYNADAAIAMTAMGTVSESWNERARRAFWPLIFGTILGAVLNFAVAAFAWTIEVFPLAVWTAVTLPCALLVFSVADLRVNRNHLRALLAGAPFDERSDLRGELTIGLLIVSLAYGVLGIVFQRIFGW